MGVPGIIEGGTAAQAKCHAAADHVDTTHEPLVTGLSLGDADGHEVSDLTYAIRRQKACHQHIGIRPIELLVTEAMHRGSDLETPALGVIEERREDAGGIEAWKTQPVD